MLISFCVGNDIKNSSATTTFYVTYVIVLSLTTPTGIGIGIGIHDGLDSLYGNEKLKNPNYNRFYGLLMVSTIKSRKWWDLTSVGHFQGYSFGCI